MQNEFIVIKEKIMEIQEEENREIVDSGVLAEQKILEEIENLKAEHEKVQNSVEGKSKIEQMKAMLQLTSIESSISLKNMELKELKENNLNNNDSEQKQHERCLNQLKEDFVNYLKEVESKIARTVKGGESEVALTKDFLDVQEYYKSIKASADKERNDVENKIKEIKREFELLDERYRRETEEMARIFEKAGEAYRKGKEELGMKYEAEANNFGTLSSQRYNQETQPLLDKNTQYCELLNSVNKKSFLGESMVDEMISELIREELKQREIVIPDFVKDTRFFKNRYED